MHIILSPQRIDKELTASIAGDIITLNGDAFDFSVIPEGATLPAEAVSSDWIVGEVNRTGGKLQMTLLLPHGPNATEAQRFPADIIDPPDGELALPKDPELEQETADEH